MMQRVYCISATIRQRHCNRDGLTLLEVLVSVAIFLGSLTAIMQLLNTGQQAEVSARLQSEAVLRCDSKMAEIVAGIEKPVSSADGTFLDDEIGSWKWSVDVTNGSATSLLKMTVKVEHWPDERHPNASFTASRYIRDPQLFIDAALAASTSTSSSASSSGTSNSSSKSSNSSPAGGSDNDAGNSNAGGNATGTGGTGGNNNGGNPSPGRSQ